MLDLLQPLFPITRSIDLGAGTRDAPAAIQSFDPIHHPVQVLAEGLITAPQLAQRPHQSSVSRLEHPLCRYPGVCSALSGRVHKEDRPRRRPPACGAALSTVGRIAGIATNPAP